MRRREAVEMRVVTCLLLQQLLVPNMYLKLSIRFVAFGWLLLLQAVAPSANYAQDTGSTVKGIPATIEELDLDFPLSNEKFRTQIDAQIVTQGTYTINNPYRYLQRVHIRPWLHYNGIENVQLSAALGFIRKFDVAETGLKKSVEIRLTGMATITQPIAATIGFIAQFQYRSSMRQYDAYYGPAITVRYTFGKGRPSNLPIVPDADVD